MAKTNDTGAQAPTQLPKNPLVFDGAEDTWLAIDGVLCLVQQYGLGLEETRLADDRHYHGLYFVLEMVRDATKELEHMDAVPRAKLREVGNE